jgi:hypothetical protein
MGWARVNDVNHCVGTAWSGNPAIPRVGRKDGLKPNLLSAKTLDNQGPFPAKSGP